MQNKVFSQKYQVPLALQTFLPAVYPTIIIVGCMYSLYFLYIILDHPGWVTLKTEEFVCVLSSTIREGDL